MVQQVKRLTGVVLTIIRSRLYTCIIKNNVMKSSTVHTCIFDGTSLEIRKFDKQITSRTLNTQETLDITIKKCYQGKST
jgi:hypothetical protein